ncbi:amidase signature domain-containing protein [Massariosphaeria phaeospora]|uniref:amidase n=1 Tax=Massariosphaeria phaeospora TaxID=100035 RepID=A0A7C8I148_9PLEO|nr:amidase signature domain-containing protein [Massariosphaeria phaeospora]
MTTSWESIAQTAQHHRDATLAQINPPLPSIDTLPLNSTPVPRTVLTDSELHITESAPETLISHLASGTLTSTAVTSAFLRRAALAQLLTNCVTELLPPAALARAAFLDNYFREHGKPIGPLHGLPVSVKEHIGMEGLTLDAGFVAWHDRVAEENAHILDVLWAAGAVFYVRTTQPQTLMHLETDNNLYGVTVNPFNRNLSAGGSSGGEGALLGMRGSCLGIGTDIGGSIRSPAAANGIYGFRPTSYRLPVSGWSATMQGAEHIVPVIGPLSTSLAGIALFTKTLIDAQPWRREPSLVPLPWNPHPQLATLPSGTKVLKIGLLLDDGVVRPHPPVLRALRSVAEKLAEVEGVQVVEWTPYRHEWAWTVISSLYFADGGREERDAIDASGEPWRPLTTFILKENGNVKALSVKEVWDWTWEREKYREYARKWGDVDVILCPAGPGVALPHNCARYWSYTSQWNLLDYPAVVAPVTKVDPAIDLAKPDYVPRNEQDEYNYQLYDEPQRYANAPVSVQLVGRRYEDEKVLEAMAYIEEKIGLPWAEFV